MEVGIYTNLQLDSNTERYDVDNATLHSRGRFPMLISNINNEYSQNTEYCNRALNIWSGDAYDSNGNLTLQTTTNYTYYHIDESQNINVNLFSDNSNNNTNQPINRTDACPDHK